MKSREAFRSRNHVESVVGQRVLERGFDRGRAVDQKIAEALFIGERANEIFLRDNDFALKDAVIECGYQLHFYATRIEHVADLAMEDVSDRIGVGDGGDSTILRIGIEQ